MIVTGDVANIIYKDCQAFGIPDVRKKPNIVPDDDKAGTGLTAERIVIIAKQQETGTYWKKGFVEVNICVPDNKSGTAKTTRLGALERQAAQLFKEGSEVVGSYDGTYYMYSISSINGCEEDKSLKCHFVNVRLLFEVLNTIEL